MARIRRETRGCIREQATILTAGWCGVVGSTAWTRIRSVGEVERGCLYAVLDTSRGCRYIYIHPVHESGIRTTGANIWSLATKNSGRANRRVDLFPYTAAFLAFFFRLSARYLLPVFRPLPPSLRTLRCLHSREYSSIYLKMTPITQVKYTRALIYCLSIYKPFSSRSPDPPLYIHAPPRSYSLWLF